MNDKRPEPPPSTVIDTREQTPWTFNQGLIVERFGCAFPAEAGTLDTGDYSVRGLEGRVRIERKSLEDFARSVTAERERFWRELERLAEFPVKGVVIEGSIGEIEALGTARVAGSARRRDRRACSRVRRRSGSTLGSRSAGPGTARSPSTPPRGHSAASGCGT